jgi:hypothetical protein
VSSKTDWKAFHHIVSHKIIFQQDLFKETTEGELLFESVHYLYQLLALQAKIRQTVKVQSDMVNCRMLQSGIETVVAKIAGSILSETDVTITQQT